LGHGWPRGPGVRARRPDVAAPQALDELAREIARALVEAAIAPQALQRDRERDHREPGEWIGGEPALLVLREQPGDVQARPLEQRPRKITGRRGRLTPLPGSRSLPRSAG